MDPEDNEGQEQQEVAPAPAETPAAPAAPAFDPSQFATKEDLAQINQGLTYLTQLFQPPEEIEEEDDGEINIDQYIQAAVDRQLQPVRPLFDATVKERGEKIMNDLFDQAQAEVGDFDRKLAERVANSFLEEHGGDPREATLAGAKYAAEIRSAERRAGVEAHNQRLRMGPPDPEPAVAGGAQKARAKDTSYDDVINRWAGETEA